MRLLAEEVVHVVLQVRELRLSGKPAAHGLLADRQDLGADKRRRGRELTGQSLDAAIALGRRLILCVHGVIHAGVDRQYPNTPRQALHRLQRGRQGRRALGQMALEGRQAGQGRRDGVIFGFPGLHRGEDTGCVPGVTGIDLAVVRDGCFCRGHDLLQVLRMR